MASRRGSKAGISGGQKAAEFFSKAGRQAVTDAERALVMGGLRVERDAKILAPVDTGRLRASITHRLEHDANGQPVVFVGTNVKYAPFIEFGTGSRGSTSSALLGIQLPSGYEYGDRLGMPAQPFLYPAFRQNKAKITEMIKKEVFRGLRGLT
jgi:HK97 gp10 family phage protein